MGGPEPRPPLTTDDGLRNDPSEHVEVVLTNPPFGKKSSVTVVNAGGSEHRALSRRARP